jgi:hypothetical protein
MTKNLYYRSVLGRPDAILNFINAFVSRLGSYPRLILEVFIRRNFGERYFRLSAVAIAAAFLLIFPYMMKVIFTRTGEGAKFWVHFTTWYLFAFVFCYVSWLRWKEVRVSRSDFEFTRYSLSSGYFHPKLVTYAYKNGKLDNRRMETLIEPAFFFIIGLGLTILLQYIGILILLISIVYSLSYIAAYRAGDNFVLDKIDEMIASERMKENFALGGDEAESDFRTRARLPNDPELRSQLLPQILVEDEPVYAS